MTQVVASNEILRENIFLLVEGQTFSYRYAQSKSTLFGVHTYKNPEEFIRAMYRETCALNERSICCGALRESGVGSKRREDIHF